MRKDVPTLQLLLASEGGFVGNCTKQVLQPIPMSRSAQCPTTINKALEGSSVEFGCYYLKNCVRRRLGDSVG